MAKKQLPQLMFDIMLMEYDIAGMKLGKTIELIPLVIRHIKNTNVLRVLCWYEPLHTHVFTIVCSEHTEEEESTFWLTKCLGNICKLKVSVLQTGQHSFAPYSSFCSARINNTIKLPNNKKLINKFIEKDY